MENMGSNGKLKLNYLYACYQTILNGMNIEYCSNDGLYTKRRNLSVTSTEIEQQKKFQFQFSIQLYQFSMKPDFCLSGSYILTIGDVSPLFSNISCTGV